MTITDTALKIVEVPFIVANHETTKGFLRIVNDFETAEVDIVPWPLSGWRPLVEGTGIEGGITSGNFVFEWKGEVLYATNHAVNRAYITGWTTLPHLASEDRTPEKREFLYTHEANYHPDGGQVFFPRNGEPFVALLALPGDDIAPENFKAFYCDGTFGIHLLPGVWHQPIFPIPQYSVFDDKQGKVHACVAVDFVKEFGCLLKVPLGSTAQLQSQL